jgi:anhydro-N-acetylmuramic acid kinase
MEATEYFIGLMSGTSLDGVDAVLARISPQGKIKAQAHTFVPFDAAFKTTLLALNESGPDELHRSALVGNQIARLYAHAVQALLQQSGLQGQDITALGAHGQTVRHRPLEFDGDAAQGIAPVGYTLQLINPALLAELTGIDVVADFRSRDLAAGGQGAPLVPAFHHGVFSCPDACVAVLNIGGISNLSVLSPRQQILGWDCGPGNALLDYWCHAHTGAAFDSDGGWAASGRVLPDLLANLMSEDFLHRAPPKSTGRDLFNPNWLQARLPKTLLRPQDVQATLTELTALACTQDVRLHALDAKELIVCGGGALNSQLMRRMAHHLPFLQVVSSEQRGLPPLQVEATAFAWLAFKAIQREPASLTSVTGAKGARVLGAIYPR